MRRAAHRRLTPREWAKASAAATAVLEVLRARRDPLERLIAAYAAICGEVWGEAYPEARERFLDAIEDIADPTAEDIERELERMGEELADWLDPETQEELRAIGADGYALGQAGTIRGIRWPEKTGASKGFIDSATAAPYSVFDQRADEWLAKDTLFWVGQAWDNKLGQDIADGARGALEHGFGRRDLSAYLRDTLTQFDRPDAYWDVVSSAAIVRGRSYGAVSGFQHAGVKELRFVAMGDERTSDVCLEMNGKVFPVSAAIRAAAAAMAAKTPDEMKDAHPWVTLSDVQGLDPATLAAAGIILPPLHGNCRSRVVAHSFYDPGEEPEVELAE